MIKTNTVTGPVENYYGATLQKYERNGYDDSDFFAIVWDEETSSILHIEYATTRFWSYENVATVDATPEVEDKAEACMAEMLFQAYTDSDYAQARSVTVKGRRVRSLTKRGKNVDQEGVVKWFLEKRSQYGTWSYGFKVGFLVDGESELRYVNDDKLEVVDPADSTDEERRIRATSMAANMRKRGQWRRGEGLYSGGLIIA